MHCTYSLILCTVNSVASFEIGKRWRHSGLAVLESNPFLERGISDLLVVCCIDPDATDVPSVPNRPALRS